MPSKVRNRKSLKAGTDEKVLGTDYDLGELRSVVYKKGKLDTPTHLIEIVDSDENPFDRYFRIYEKPITITTKKTDWGVIEKEVAKLVPECDPRQMLAEKVEPIKRHFSNPGDPEKIKEECKQMMEEAEKDGNMFIREEDMEDAGYHKTEFGSYESKMRGTIRTTASYEDYLKMMTDDIKNDCRLLLKWVKDGKYSGSEYVNEVLKKLRAGASK